MRSIARIRFCFTTVSCRSHDNHMIINKITLVRPNIHTNLDFSKVRVDTSQNIHFYPRCYQPRERERVRGVNKQGPPRLE